MNKKVLIIYAKKYAKANNEGLKSYIESLGGEVYIKDSKLFLSQSEYKSKIGKIYILIRTIFQAIRCILWGNKMKINTYICWSLWTGIIISILAPSNCKVISLGWLTPEYTGKFSFAFKKAISKKNTIIVGNSSETFYAINKLYGYLEPFRYRTIPDVLEENYKRCELIIPPKGNRYVFCGGMSNRDWKSYIEAARFLTNVEFVAVAKQEQWPTIKDLPDNLRVYFNIPETQYYELLRNCYITCFPLKDSRVAGLINVLKSVENGKICLISNTPAAAQYYNDESLLMDIRNTESIVAKIQSVYSYSETDYKNKFIGFRNYIESNYSAEASNKIIAELALA